LFLISDVLATAQFHIQPNKDSSVKVPIGFVTIEPERIKDITELLKPMLTNFGAKMQSILKSFLAKN
jgi:hypothetical protein